MVARKVADLKDNEEECCRYARTLPRPERGTPLYQSHNAQDSYPSSPQEAGRHGAQSMGTKMENRDRGSPDVALHRPHRHHPHAESAAADAERMFHCVQLSHQERAGFLL